MRIRHLILLLAATLEMGFSAAEGMRLFVNGDNDHWFRRRGPEKMTREAMIAYIDDIAQGGKVTDFVMCTMGQRASYDSKVCEPIWAGAGEPGADRWVTNAKLCHERGLDVYRIWIDRCREKGIVPWISMRMNDVHGVTGKDWFRTCGFWRKHPELRRHPELDPLKGGGGWLNFTLDYAHKEVRDYHLAIFRELVDRYDADGYELDWMRWPCCFREGREKEDAHFLTEFMRECRAYANASAAKRGHPIRLCVRVPQKLVCAEGFGLDPVCWAKEGLVDLIVPTCFIQAYDYELDFAGWTKSVAEANPKVEVVPGGANMFSASDYGGTVPFELAAWRGWCDNMFAQGAKGVYLFNADYLEPAVRSEVYRKGIDPVQAAKSRRRLLSSFDDITSVEGTLGQRCPFSSREGKTVVISGGTAETVRDVAVVLAMSVKGEAPQVELNGMRAMSEPTRIADCTPYCAKVAKDAWCWTFPRTAFRTGPNEVKVCPNAAASDSNMTVWCEISLNTKEVKPLCADESAALRFLEFVTGPMPAADEREWWEIGGGQFGLFAKRYNIAFAGYAAAALGMRGSEEERNAVGQILDNSIRRMLARGVWAYSQTPEYWGEKPWAPDPCFRENVMYTGHLLQLLALYETFTHDTKYWTRGFDFEWNKEKRVHYDVKKLIDVTVDQMRTNDFCGVTCEPGLLFFPCNNHPQVAFKLFKKLGHGDWSADSRRWEKWALDHFLSPFFGGGAINLLYHVKSGMFYPRGSAGLDGWSLLWYEPWAEKRETSLALWKTAAAKIDWDDMDAASDAARKCGGCCDPLAVPHSVTAAFLAAAARANDDPVTAARLEKAVDAHLVRTNGLYYLNLNREWRIGATAHRIISLAEANGSSFRRLAE